MVGVLDNCLRAVRQVRFFFRDANPLNLSQMLSFCTGHAVHMRYWRPAFAADNRI